MFESWKRLNRIEKMLWLFAFHLLFGLCILWGVMPAWSYWKPLSPVIASTLVSGIVLTIIALFVTKGKWDEE